MPTSGRALVLPSFSQTSCDQGANRKHGACFSFSGNFFYSFTDQREKNFLVISGNHSYSMSFAILPAIHSWLTDIFLCVPAQLKKINPEVISWQHQITVHAHITPSILFHLNKNCFSFYFIKLKHITQSRVECNSHVDSGSVLFSKCDAALLPTTEEHDVLPRTSKINPKHVVPPTFKWGCFGLQHNVSAENRER